MTRTFAEACWDNHVLLCGDRYLLCCLLRDWGDLSGLGIFNPKLGDGRLIAWCVVVTFFQDMYEGHFDLADYLSSQMVVHPCDKKNTARDIVYDPMEGVDDGMDLPICGGCEKDLSSPSYKHYAFEDERFVCPSGP